MKETTVQIDGMMSIFDGAGVEKQIKRRDGVVRVNAHSGAVLNIGGGPPAIHTARLNARNDWAAIKKQLTDEGYC